MRARRVKLFSTSAFLFLLSFALLTTGCSESILITKQGHPASANSLTIDQFLMERSGNFFEAVLTDSSSFPMQLLTVRNDSLHCVNISNGLPHAIPFKNVSKLMYRRNDGGFLATIGGFAGLFSGGIIASTAFDVNNNRQSITAFVVVLSAAAAGAVAGYNSETEIEYYFNKK